MLYSTIAAQFGFFGGAPGRYHYQGGRDRSHTSFNTALDRSNRVGEDPRSFNYSRGSGGDNKNFYAQVRDRVRTSPDAKMYQQRQDSGAPVNRFQGRGSVVSPQSMYREPNSIYQEGHY